MQSKVPLDPDPKVVDGTVGKVAYVEAGDEGPCLLLVHGCPGSRRDFRWWMQGLSEWAHVVAVDMPGYGEARPTAFPPTTAGRSAYLSEVLDTVGVRKAYVVSHSFGSTVAVDFALRYSERVQGVAMLAPAGPKMHMGLRRFHGRSLFYRLASLPVVGEPALLRLKKAMTVAGFSKYLEPDEILRMLELLEHFSFPDYAAQLLDLEAPAWVAHAADDPFIEYAIVEELVACLGKPRFHVLAEGGHNIQKTMAVELNQALKAWICDA